MRENVFFLKLLYGTKKRWHETVTKLSHPIEGRYFKLLPKHWTTDGYACMRLEMYGCDANVGK